MFENYPDGLINNDIDEELVITEDPELPDKMHEEMVLDLI